MAYDEGRLDELAGTLRKRLPARDSFNLVPVVVPPGDVRAAGERLAELIGGHLFDYDAQAIVAMEEEGWDRYLAFERAEMKSAVRSKLSQVSAQVRELAQPDRPVVVHNVNLPVPYEFGELANDLYRASAEGMVVLCVGGSVRGGRVMLHHKLALTGTSLVDAVELTL